MYRKNVGGATAAPSFAAPKAVGNLASLGHDSSTTFTAGAEAFSGVGVMLDKSWTRTTGDSYMSDVNGDGLLDLVVGGQVLFNRLVNGVPSFGPNSPTPLAAGANSDTGGMIPDPDAGRAEMEAAFHLVDPVRAWVAPYDGKVAITGQVKLLTAAPADYPADGVRASIQLGGDELWTTTIANPRDLTPKAISGLDEVAVSAGDRIYFRVHSINDGAYDAVEFNPTITYTGEDAARTDENGMPIFVYNAGSDYAYGGRPIPFTTPFNGTATLTGNLVKSAATTDDLTVLVLQNGTPVHEQTITADQTGTFAVQANLTTTAQQQIEVRLVADSRIDLSGVRFSPQLVYQTVDGQPAPKDQSGASLLVFPPPVAGPDLPASARGRARPRRMSRGSRRPTASSTCTRRWRRPARQLPADYAANVTLTIKRDGERLAKLRAEIRDGELPGPQALDARIEVAKGDRLFFSADITSAETGDKNAPAAGRGGADLARQRVIYELSLPVIVQPDVDVHVGLAPSDAFGGGFRGWWFGQYNGRDGAQPIDESRLRLPVDDQDDAAKDFLQMIPALADDQWRAEDEDTWISATGMSSSRLKVKHLDFEDGGGLGGGARREALQRRREQGRGHLGQQLRRRPLQRHELVRRRLHGLQRRRLPGCRRQRRCAADAAQRRPRRHARPARPRACAAQHQRQQQREPGRHDVAADPQLAQPAAGHHQRAGRL